MTKKKNIIKLQNQGFCYGVNHSIKLVCQCLNDKNTKRPIYLLNSIVHNEFVNSYFLSRGVIILEGKSKLELLDEVTEGTIIFSAHGVSDKVKEKAKAKNLNIIDATCPFVEKSYHLIKEKLNDGYFLIYIGKLNHPETEAVVSFSNDIMVVNSTDFTLPNKAKLAIAHQTTISDYDVMEVYNVAQKLNPNIVILPMICNATSKRQEELKNILINSDLSKSLVIIVGDKTSNNCTKLYELSKRYTDKTIFIKDYHELFDIDLSLYDSFIVSSGTSTPLVNVENVIKLLNGKRIFKKMKLIDYIK